MFIAPKTTDLLLQEAKNENLIYHDYAQAQLV